MTPRASALGAIRYPLMGGEDRMELWVYSRGGGGDQGIELGFDRRLTLVVYYY